MPDRTLFISDIGKEYRLNEALEDITGEYDYIIIDTPPALEILTVNSLIACHNVIIPAQADIYSLQEIEQLAEIIENRKEVLQPSFSYRGNTFNTLQPPSYIEQRIS